MAPRSVRSILCPIDFSPQSELALSYAILLADRFGAALAVAHAERFEPPLEFTSAQVDTIAAELRKIKKDALTYLRAHVEKRHPGMRAEYLLMEDHPVDGILQAANESAADLVVMGTTGRSGLERIMMGSVAESVTRASRVPVLTVRNRPGGEPAPRLERILVPVNYTEPAAEALHTASQFGRALDARLIVASIIESEHEDEDSARRRLCEWVPSRIQANCEYEAVARKGSAAEEIVRIAAERDADLVVVAAVHRPFLETTIIGSTSERVVRYAPCPVLTVPIHSG